MSRSVSDEFRLRYLFTVKAFVLAEFVLNVSLQRTRALYI